MQKQFFVYILFFISHISVGQVQHFNFTAYNVENGLPQSQTFSIKQDSLRHLWIATLGGVARFDGKTFTNYTTEDSLLSNFSRAILIDRHQHIWIGSQVGISFFNGRSFKNHYLAKPGKTPNSISLVEDGQGTVWAAYDNELYEVSKDFCKKVTPMFLRNERIVLISKDVDGKLLVATATGSVFKKIKEQWKSIPFKKISAGNIIIKKMINTPYGFTLIMTNEGLYQCINEHIVPLPVQPGTDILNQATTIYAGRDSAYWIGTYRGVYKITSQSVFYFTAENGFTDHTVTDIMSDAEDNIWFATSGSGLLKFSNGNISYYDRSAGFPNPIIVGITKDKANRIWFGSYGGGLTKYDHGKLSNYKIPGTDPRSQIINFCIADSSGSLWIGTNGGGLWQMKDNIYRDVSKSCDCKENLFLCGAVTKNGTKYFGTPNGLYRSVNNTIEKVKGIAGYITAIHIVGEDSIYIGTSQAAFLVKKQSDVFSSVSLFSSSILAITGTGNHIYFGSADNGIYIWNSIDGKLSGHTRKKNGLSSNNIYSLAFDGYGALWVSTGFNLNRMFLGKTGMPASIKIFSKNDGLLSPEGNQNSLLIDKDTVWAGSINGVYRITIGVEDKKMPPPKIFLQDVRLFSAAISEDAYYDSLSAINNIPVNLKLPSNKNNLTFEIKAIYLSNPDDVTYQYMIKGMDKAFSPPTNINSVVYGNIPPGKYTFIARALTQHSTVVSASVFFQFEIEAPFYQTKLFIFFFIVFIIAIVRLLYVIVKRNKEKRKRNLEAIRAEEQENIRKRTAEDFHDEMGNKITRISILSEILKKKSADANEVNNLVEQIKINSQELYHGTKDIIWSLGTEGHNLFYVLNRIKNFAVDIFQDTGCIFSYSGIDAGFEKIALPSDFSRNLGMIFKEAMTNILKHASAKTTSLTVTFTPYDHITISLKDDGKGFDMNAINKGNGLDNIQLRARRLHADLQIDSVLGEGTSLILKFRIP